MIARRAVRKLAPRAVRSVATAVCLAGLAVLSACSSSSGGGAAVSSNKPTDHVLRLSFLQDPGQPPDPDVYYAGQGLALTLNTYEGLLTYQLGTATPTIVGSLATAWTVSPDKKTYTLTLRKGVTFHDGTPFTSAAVEPSFARRAAVNQGPAYMVSDVASVKTPSPYQVVITLKGPNSAFLDYLAAPYGPKMMSPTGLKQYGGSDHAQKYLSTHDLGTGAYTLTDARVGQHYALKAYPKWWGTAPYFTEIDLPVVTDLSTEELEFDKGQLAAIMHDLNAPAVKSYLNSSTSSHYSLPTFETSQVYLNPNTTALKDTATRVALQQAINIKTLANQVFNGRGTIATGTYGPGMLKVTDTQKVPYDPSKLQALAKTLPASSKSLTFGYDTSQPDDQQMANIVAADMQAYGLNVKVQGYPTSQVFGWVSDVKGAPDVLFTEMWPDAANPYTWSHILYDKDGGLNYLHCSSPSVSDLLPGVLKTGDETTYTKIGDAAMATGCWLNVAYRNDFMVTQKWLTGVEQSHNVAAPTTLIFSGLGA
ncbi:MAG: peptide/nickel transport system substrate-binding protein [Pseudonocardiales bacterium]|jgi:peptide/nickel transport system substrate-binding protein|nr:peptide/nickel transport system substrate-binding protein [Pseudonocardiales bacterium]MDT4944595.1 peptide/nickel transport system substrate-binding protein [Pseudonocardiales bacterium]